MSRRARITVVTAGHPSTCPRMVKAADALAEAGHDVRFVCARFIEWATATDADLLGRRRWRATVVDYGRNSAPSRSLKVRARRRLAAALVASRGVDASPWWAVTRAFSYAHPELVRAATSEPADFFYGGTTGGLAVAAEAAQATGCPYALDLEDLHTAESEGPHAALQHALAGRIESRVLKGARLLTTSSAAIADVYRRKYGLQPDVIHNVFPLPAAPPLFDTSSGPLRVYWFGQTIGSGRGLEEFIDGAGASGRPAALTVRGNEADGFVPELRRRAAERAPLLTIDALPPAAPDDMVSRAMGHDIGLSLEMPTVENRERCLSNKLLTYLPAGLAVIATSTLGQREVASTTGEAVAWYSPGDLSQLAAHLRRWDDHRDALLRARREAWGAAARRWHWEHPLERGRLIAAINGALA